MNKYFLCSMGMSVAISVGMAQGAWFAYDRAVRTAQKGAWDEAKKKLTKLVVNAPDSSSLLYDTGVASYRAKDFEHALAYFKRVYEAETSSTALKEQAHFNAGNTQVALEDLAEAVNEYEQTLAINPENEFARHNLEKVKALLEQKQKKQEEQKKNEQQEQPSQGDNQSEHEQSSEQHNDDQPSNGDEKKDSSQESSSQKQEHGSPNQQSSEQNASDERDGSDEQSCEPQEQNQQEQEEKNKQKKDSDNRSDESANQSPEDANNSQPGETAPENQSSESGDERTAPEKTEQQSVESGAHAQETEEQESTQMGHAAQERADRQPAVDQWVAQLLDEHEQHDAQLNKQVIKATVNKELAGKHGENCW